MMPITDDERQRIQESAELCREATLNTMGVSLNYDEQSICAIDEIYSRAWPAGPGDNPKRNATRYQLWGCFLGEALRRVMGGEWVRTEGGYGVRVGNVVAHPITKIEKRSLNGMEDSITFFYKTFVAQSRGENVA